MNLIKVTEFIVNNSTIIQLRAKSKKCGIKGYSKNKKAVLQENIKKIISTKYIQRWFRKNKGYNDTCLISMEEIKYPCWPVKQQNGWIYYNLPDLVDYMLSSGVFKCPISKYSFNAKELTAMDIYTKKVGILRKSVFSAKKNPGGGIGFELESA